MAPQGVLQRGDRFFTPSLQLEPPGQVDQRRNEFGVEGQRFVEERPGPRFVVSHEGDVAQVERRAGILGTQFADLEQRFLRASRISGGLIPRR